MSNIRWRHPYYINDRAYSTADAGERSLAGGSEGVAERAAGTADNTLRALCRLVETLHDRGMLSNDEVRHVLELHGYDLVEDE